MKKHWRFHGIMGHKHSNFVAYGLGIMSSGSCHTEGLTGKACNPRERRPAQSMHKSSLTHGFVQRGLRGLFTTVIHLDLFRCCHGLRTLLMVRNMRTQRLFFPGHPRACPKSLSPARIQPRTSSDNRHTQKHAVLFIVSLYYIYCK